MFSEIRRFLIKERGQQCFNVNTALTLLFWCKINRKKQLKKEVSFSAENKKHLFLLMEHGRKVEYVSVISILNLCLFDITFLQPSESSTFVFFYPIHKKVWLNIVHISSSMLLHFYICIKLHVLLKTQIKIELNFSF